MARVPKIPWSNGFTKSSGGTDYVELHSLVHRKEGEGIGV
jgi:hypothetical protein